MYIFTLLLGWVVFLGLAIWCTESVGFKHDPLMGLGFIFLQAGGASIGAMLTLLATK